MTLAAAATSSMGSATAMTMTRSAEKRIAKWGVARSRCTRATTWGRLASRAMAKATREEE